MIKEMGLPLTSICFAQSEDFTRLGLQVAFLELSGCPPEARGHDGWVPAARSFPQVSSGNPEF